MAKKGSVQIYYSSHVEILVDALNCDIRAHRKIQQNPLKALNVIIPSGHIQKYLNLRLTEINGISANMQFPFLETGLYAALMSLNTSDQEPKLLTLADMELSIWAFLCNELNNNDARLSPFEDYLKGQQNQSVMSKKRWQLAQQLALLFIDYEMSRPEMIRAWLSDQLFFNDSSNQHLKQIELAQSVIYKSLFNSGDDSLTLSGLLSRIELSEPVDPVPIFIFAPSRLSPLHRQIILLLSTYLPVHIYHLNVCREFWQDMETNDEINWKNRIRQLNLTATDADGHSLKSDEKVTSRDLNGEAFFDLEQGLGEFENPLLTAWGKPGRETLRLFSDLENDAIHAGIDYQDYLLDERNGYINEPAGDTLSALQNGVLDRVPGENRLSPLKNTVLIASAPSIEVEVSQVYNSILYELKQDNGLQLTDVVVLVSDMSSYRYVIEQVFDRLNKHLSSPLRYSISDSSAGEESLYARAVIQLLSILDTDFIRDEVFSFLLNPCVENALNCHPGEIDAWLQAAVDLGVYRGFSQLYDAPDEDMSQLYTWQQGLQRLHRSLVQSTAEKSPLDVSQTGRLSVIMAQLNQFKSQFNKQKSASQWQQSLQKLLDTFIAIPDDYPQEEAVALSVTQYLQQLAENQTKALLSFDDIKHYLLSRLTEMSAGRGRYLSGGVVCAALQPMRPVPFKLTYVLGLNEAKFPGQIRHNTLDLAAYSRRIGDVNQVDNNKYLFLETIMSTRHKLFLSYVGRDEESGDSLDPSVVITDVMEWVNQYTDNQLKPVSLPLAASDNFKHQALQGNQSFNQNHRLSDYLWYCHQANPFQAVHKTELGLIDNQQGSDLNQFNSIINESDGTEGHKTLSNLAPNIQLNIRDLSDYLINPTEAIYKHQGGILRRIEDKDLMSDEPITINPLDKHQLFNNAVKTDLHFQAYQTADYQSDRAPDIAAILEHEYSVYLQQSQVPIKLFASIEPLKDIDKDETYQSLKRDIEEGNLIPWSGNLMVGQSYSQQAVTQKVPACRVAIAQTQVDIAATIRQLLNNKDQQIAGQIIIRAGDYKKDKSLELLTRAFTEWCLMILHDELDLTEDYCVWLIFQNKVMTYDFKRYLVDKKTIEDYLRLLSHEFSIGNNDYLPLSLRSALSFKYSLKDPDAPIKAYPFKDKIYFAYKNVQPHMTEELEHNYQQAVAAAGDVPKSYDDKKTISYDEIKYILNYPPAENFLHDYQARFRLFFAVIDHIDIRAVA